MACLTIAFRGCPAWTEWTEWTQCSKSCGAEGTGGRRVRVRECKIPESRSAFVLLCDGPEKIIEKCNDDVSCATWTPWTSWTECSQTCGEGGVRKRGRECLGGERDCEGEDEESESCSEEKPCPTLTPWSDWTECSVSCGGGKRRRVRDCVGGPSGVEGACGEALEETEGCAEDACKQWTPWSGWSECSSECGGGKRSRVRECKRPDPFRSQRECPGPAEDAEECGDAPCPEWTPWGEWGACSSACGPGQRRRARQCTSPSRWRQSCPGETSEDGECDSGPCPEWPPWSEWSLCSATCGEGSRRRTRRCSQGEDANGVNPCGEGDDSQDEVCDSGAPCPGWSPWSEWSSCNKPCGGGETTRQRTCQAKGDSYGRTAEKVCYLLPVEFPAAFYALQPSCEGPATMMLFCNLQPCQPEWSDWSPWSSCSATCGDNGMRRRQRSCEGPRSESKLGLLLSPCPGSPQEAERCSANEACGE